VVFNEQEGNIVMIAYLELDDDVCFFNTIFTFLCVTHHLARYE
jgi:hypothetical protein